MSVSFDTVPFEPNTVYVRPVSDGECLQYEVSSDKPMYGVFDLEGDLLAITTDAETAFDTAVERDSFPLWAH